MNLLSIKPNDRLANNHGLLTLLQLLLRIDIALVLRELLGRAVALQVDWDFARFSVGKSGGFEREVGDWEGGNGWGHWSLLL